MSTAMLARTPASVASRDDAELLRLYARCKALTLAVSASLLLADDEDAAALRADALLLARRAATAAEAHGAVAAAEVHGAVAPPGSHSRFALIQEAAQAVAALGDPATDADQALERLRVSHRELRAGLGALLAPQYAPCGAHDHLHVKEENHG